MSGRFNWISQSAKRWKHIVNFAYRYTGSVEILLYFPIIISNLKSTYTFLPYNEGVIILKKKKKRIVWEWRDKIKIGEKYKND